jgi:hypothetical protein
MPIRGLEYDMGPSAKPGFNAVQQQFVNQTTQPQQPVQPQSPQITPPIGSQQSVVKPPPFDPSTLDSAVVKVMQSIRNVESQGNYNAVGDNGSSMGAYQWNNGKDPVEPGQTPINWQNAAKQFLGSADAPMTPENQNYVAYSQIKAYKDQGLTPNSIDALWNGARPDPQNPGQFVHINPQRATEFQNALTNIVNGTPQNNPTQPYQAPDPQHTQNPSLLGFGENAIQSGANFLGNTANALIHPIQTVQNIGSMAAGGLQELGGQTNDNTAKWDALTNYFKQRYGSVDAFSKSAYTDPIGVLADASAVLGVGGAAAKLVGKAGELASTASAADSASAALNTGIRTMAGDQAIGNAFTRGASAVSDTLGGAAMGVNPLTPVIKGAGKLANATGLISSELGSQLTGLEPQTIDQVIANPSAFTPEQIANSSRMSVAQDVETALQQKIATLDETGAGYGAVRENAANVVRVSPTFLDEQLRSQAGVDVTDGQISATGASKVRSASDIRALQQLYDTWKPEFQDGQLTQNEFLNFRQDLATAAKFEREFSVSKPVESVAAGIRGAFNDTYRPQIAGLAEKDATFSSQIDELNNLRKGLIDKNGNLLDSAINKIANAVGKGKDLQLAKLEEISPGITQKLSVLKAMEDIQKIGGTKVGTYPSAFLKAGGVLTGIATGNMATIGAAAAYMIISSPDVAIPLLRALGGSKELIAVTMAHLAKFLTLGEVSKNVLNGAQLNQQQEAPQTQQTVPQTEDTGVAGQSQPQQANSSSPNPITQTPAYQAANKIYSDTEIQQFLQNNPDIASKYLASQGK